MDHFEIMELCVNCSRPLNSLTQDEEKIHRKLSKDDGQSEEEDVGSILSTIYRLQEVEDFNCDKNNIICCCSPCGEVLKNLYKYFLEFASLRQLNSQLSRAILKSFVPPLDNDISNTQFDEHSSSHFKSSTNGPWVVLDRLTSTDIPDFVKEESDEGSYEPPANDGGSDSDNFSEDKTKMENSDSSSSSDPPVDDPIKIPAKKRRRRTEESSTKKKTMPSHTRKFTCFHCNEIFFNIKSHNIHVQTVHNRNPLDCHMCDLTFLSRRKLVHHYKVSHDQLLTTWKCSKCDKVLNYKESYLRHMRRHEVEESCPVCSESFPEMKLLKVHMTSDHPDELHSCPRCHLTYCFPHQLEIHQKTCGMNSVTCDLCGLTFTRKKSLLVHIQCVHDKIKSELCNLCGQQFARKSYLKSHMLIHNQEKPHQCKICHKYFRHLSALKTHENVHLNLKSYLCSLCGSKFNHKSNFERHARVHSNLRPYNCEVEGCDRAFKTSNNLRTHEKLVHAENKTTTKIGRGIGKKKVEVLDEME